MHPLNLPKTGITLSTSLGDERTFSTQRYMLDDKIIPERFRKNLSGIPDYYSDVRRLIGRPLRLVSNNRSGEILPYLFGEKIAVVPEDWILLSEVDRKTGPFPILGVEISYLYPIP